jgi:CelD/BcsL family acetyltransferase involved in cellulose biosynthesis
MAEAKLLGAAEALREHRPRWRELAELRGNAFVTPEWFEAWLEHYGQGAEVSVAAVNGEDGELLGLVPFAVAGSALSRSARIAGSNLADYVHPVAAAGDEAAVAQAALAALAEADRSWGALVLDNVDASSAWWRAELRDGRGAELRRRERSASVLPYASLAFDSYDDYLASRSASFRKQLRRLDRRLEREAAIELRQTSDASELRADLATFFRLHFARWEGRGGSSLAGGSAQAFHETFAAAALEADWLRLLVLEAAGEPIAAFYGWRVGGRFAFYQAGFDEAWSKFSVGLILHGRVIERALAEGADEYDMLLGSEPYKFRFCESVRDVATQVLTRRRHPAALAVAADLGARRLAARLPEGLRTRLGRFERRLPTGRAR